MTSRSPFETMAAEYDAWFEAHPRLFESELRAIRAVLPEPRGRWVEVGVGTGRFASRLGIGLGVEPAAAMARRAEARGICVLRGAAERLPLPTACIDAVFFVTTLCFVSDVDRSLAEAARVLVPDGHIIAAILPRDSELGRRITMDPSDSFFRIARLLTPRELGSAMARAGFEIEREVGTLADLSDLGDVEEPREGAVSTSFVVLRAVRRADRPRTRSRQS